MQGSRFRGGSRCFGGIDEGCWKVIAFDQILAAGFLCKIEKFVWLCFSSTFDYIDFAALGCWFYVCVG